MENIASLNPTSLAADFKLTLLTPDEIKARAQDYIGAHYLAFKDFKIEGERVVVRLAVAKEETPCFGPYQKSQENFTYRLRNTGGEWKAELVGHPLANPFFGVKPNNGMHPTPHTLPLINLQSLGAAGDAGRYAAYGVKDELMELKIKVICEGLPGVALTGSPAGPPVDRRVIYLGIQRGDDIVEAVPVNRKRVVFEPSFRVLPLPEDKTNFLGPFAKGTPTQRFFYLSWAAKGAGGKLTRLGRAKVHLSHLRWTEVEESLRSGKPLAVRLSLTDKRGLPRCGSIRGEDVSWQA